MTFCGSRENASRLARLLGAVICCALLLGATTAEAQSRDVKERAKQYVIDGLAAHSAARYDDAILLYNLAYDLIPHPELLFNLGQSHRLKGEKEKALDYYRKYVIAEPAGRAAKEAREWVTQLESELALAEAQRIEEERRAEEAKRIAEAKRAQATEQQSQSPSAADRASQPSVEPTPKTAPAFVTTPPAEREEHASMPVRRKLAIGVAAVAVVALGTAITFEISGQSALDDYNRFPTEKRYDEANAKHLTAQYVAIGGATCGALAAYLWLSGKRSPASAPRARITPLMTPAAAGVYVLGGF